MLSEYPPCLRVPVSSPIRSSPLSCPWPGNPLAQHYHDTEWGVPTRDDRTLFEFLILEAAQAGLSWDTILKKRPAYRAAYHNFDPRKVARFTAADAKRLLAAPKDKDQLTIVRNRLKVESSITNARLFLEVQKTHGTFADFIWSFVDGKPIQHNYTSMKQIKPTTSESDAMSKALKKLGFRFVGSTICCAFMQATGMVNDHLTDCPRHAAVKRADKPIHG